MANIKDDEFYVKKNDIDAIRKRPTMYIGSLGAKGVYHLCKEMIDNNRDECFKSVSPGNEINILITKKMVISSDNGRGIPTNLLRTVHETNQAGSNMTRANGYSAGENGTGTTTYTAMSSYLKVESFRPTEKKKMTIEYKEGVLINEKIEKYTGTAGGLRTTFVPSKKVLGVDEIPIDMLVDWLSEFNYTLPKKVRMVYQIEDQKPVVIKPVPLETYFSDPKHEVCIPYEARLSDDLLFSFEGKLKEEALGKTYNRTFKLDVCIMYADPEKYKGEDIRHSWMNMIHTSQNGDHVNGVLGGYTKFIKERLIAKNKKFAEVNMKRDIEAHMSIVVRAWCDYANMFSAQAKQAVLSDPLRAAIREATYNELSKIATSPVVNNIIDVIIGNYRARIEGEKARNISSSTKAIKTWQKPDSYYPASSVKTVQPKELYLVEGKSAGGGLKGARDASYQAILTFRGKSLNVWDETLSRVLQSQTWLNLVKVLGCGIGTTFDMKKLAFDKIIISTDADIDGYHIRVILIIFFVKYYPEIIQAGKLYIAEPPLYKLASNKDILYVASQSEYIDACINSIGDLEINFPEK